MNLSKYSSQSRLVSVVHINNYNHWGRNNNDGNISFTSSIIVSPASWNYEFSGGTGDGDPGRSDM